MCIYWSVWSAKAVDCVGCLLLSPLNHAQGAVEAPAEPIWEAGGAARVSGVRGSHPPASAVGVCHCTQALLADTVPGAKAFTFSPVIHVWFHLFLLPTTLTNVFLRWQKVLKLEAPPLISYVTGIMLKWYVSFWAWNILEVKSVKLLKRPNGRHFTKLGRLRQILIWFKGGYLELKVTETLLRITLTVWTVTRWPLYLETVYFA